MAHGAGVGMRGSGRSPDVWGCPGSVKDNPHAALGMQRRWGKSLHPASPSHSPPALPGDKNQTLPRHLHVILDESPHPFLAQGLPTSPLSPDQDCPFPWVTAPRFPPNPMAFGGKFWALFLACRKIRKATIAGSPACREPLETRATAQRFCLPSQGCSRQNKAPNATAN